MSGLALTGVGKTPVAKHRTGPQSQKLAAVIWPAAAVIGDPAAFRTAHGVGPPAAKRGPKLDHRDGCFAEGQESGATAGMAAVHRVLPRRNQER